MAFLHRRRKLILTRLRKDESWDPSLEGLDQLLKLGKFKLHFVSVNACVRSVPFYGNDDIMNISTEIDAWITQLHFRLNKISELEAKAILRGIAFPSEGLRIEKEAILSKIDALELERSNASRIKRD